MCYDELKSVERLAIMTDTTIDKLLDFQDSTFCELIDQHCPVLATALQGSLGVRLEENDDTKVCRSIVYGVMFKTRYIKI